ncbi:hypothetical protein OIU78_018828 [Salix suchowensis]|nr:hypothetical protein OIU78_018828 [Salix suchowensis]
MSNCKSYTCFKTVKRVTCCVLWFDTD